jgi:Cu/Ag efflux protein CusF
MARGEESMNTKTHEVLGAHRSAMRLCAVLALATLAQFGIAADAGAAAAKAFATPDALFGAVFDAAKAGDEAALAALFGPAGARIVKSGDTVRDRASRESFVTAFTQKHVVNMHGETEAELVVGNDDWPFPVPAVKGATGWTLDSAAGVREIVARRIGENELLAIETVRAIGDAEFDYASVPREGKDTQYARKIISTPGHRDGLYWKTAEGEADSPLGPLVASATQQGYTKATPYHGYHYRILTGQGKNAKGGARDYVVHGNMIGGFGVIAWPAQYGDTGIMTFIMDQDGVVHQKDLGEHTVGVASKMTRFDPDATWAALDASNSVVTVAAAGAVPGGVGGVRVVEATATITAIDKATREVTLKGPQGDEFVVQAGPDIKNFEAMKVGDHVHARYVEALTLDLHKGSTAPVARHEDTGVAAAKPGQNPAGAVGRQVTIVAEVVAVDMANKTVTLRGPNRTVVLPVDDAERLKGVAKGDRVVATYTEALAIAVGPAN